MTQHILFVQSSIFGDQGVSSGIARKLVNSLSVATASEVIERNVSADEIPHFNLDTINAITEQKAELADELIAEVQRADTIVIAAPMYNFAIPTQLKSWFDHIARAGVTFKYTETGPVGLLMNKKVYIVSARGGLHKQKGTDLDVRYLTTMLAFLGLTNVEFIDAEGVNLGDEARSKSIDAAEKQALALV
ncbi:FMN-dependent NADH-azoreductase [Aliiglaciecola aliphaticivorans]